MSVHRSLLASALLALGATFACSAAEPVTKAPEILAPGSKALEQSDPTCSKNDDCDHGELCVDGYCQMSACGTQAYQSAPPLGRRSYFAVDRELVVLDDDASEQRLNGYEPTSGSFAKMPDKISFGSSRIVDEAGGNFTGTRPESVAVAIEGRSSVTVVSGAKREDLVVGFVPIALASGDVDGDGTDEIAALSAQGDVAVCTMATKSCVRRKVSFTARDLTMADVDGDGRAEPVVLGDKGNVSFVVMMNFDDEGTGQSPVVELDTGHKAQRITAADFDKSGRATVVTLEDGGYAGFASDTVRFIGWKDGKLTDLGEHAIAKDAIDVLAADTDADDKAELLVLEDSGLELFDVASATSIRSAFKTTLLGSTKPTRLAMADLDGDSPAGTLVGDAALVAGPVVPVSVIAYPPYSRTWSDGNARIFVGNREIEEVNEATTVTLRATLAVGYEADFPGIAKVGLYGRVEGTLARTTSNARAIVVGDRYMVDAKPEIEGPDNGIAVLSCACFHAYTYEVEDPAGKLGSRAADHKKMSLFVPVGGQTSLWSLKRYNVLADHLGTLPVVHIPYAVGDPKSYPSTMQKFSGEPIPEGDLVVHSPRTYRTSDVANVGWELVLAEEQGQSDSTTIGVGLRGVLRVGPVVAEADLSTSVGTTYTVTLGRDASFSGFVPPVRNDVRTPENEHELYGYGFSPIVYRDMYKTRSGQEGGLFAVTYAVTP